MKSLWITSTVLKIGLMVALLVVFRFGFFVFQTLGVLPPPTLPSIEDVQANQIWVAQRKATYDQFKKEQARKGTFAGAGIRLWENVRLHPPSTIREDLKEWATKW